MSIDISASFGNSTYEPDILLIENIILSWDFCACMGMYSQPYLVFLCYTEIPDTVDCTAAGLHAQTMHARCHALFIYDYFDQPRDTYQTLSEACTFRTL